MNEKDYTNFTDRVIYQINFSNEVDECDSATVGIYKVTDIKAVLVPGNGANVPWFDVYVEGKLWCTVPPHRVISITY